MQTAIKRTVIILNLMIFTACGYVYGYHQGTTQPRIDPVAIERAVALALMDQ